jgi:hypothetical protein
VSPTWWIPSKTPLPKPQPNKPYCIGIKLEFVTLGPATVFYENGVDASCHIRNGGHQRSGA